MCMRQAPNMTLWTHGDLSTKGTQIRCGEGRCSMRSKSFFFGLRYSFNVVDVILFACSTDMAEWTELFFYATRFNGYEESLDWRSLNCSFENNSAYMCIAQGRKLTDQSLINRWDVRRKKKSSLPDWQKRVWAFPFVACIFMRIPMLTGQLGLTKRHMVRLASVMGAGHEMPMENRIAQRSWLSM